MALSAIRSLWNNYQSDNSDSSDSNLGEDDDEFSEKRQLTINLSQTLRTRQLLVNFHGRRPVFSLRAPLGLVNFPTIPRPRWPIECDVIVDGIQHIEWEPPEPEPFYQVTGHERTPMYVGDDRGKVVFSSGSENKCSYFTCSWAGGNRSGLMGSTPHINPKHLILEFESRFESGNLQKAVQVGVYDYELTLRTDMYTAKHTQWFYFRVRNMRVGVTYRFTILNLMKRNSLYVQGLKPLIYSEKEAKENGVGWHRIGTNIKHYRNCCESAKNNGEEISLYCLTWTFQFPYESDTCYFAHCYPYTYSRIQQYLRKLSSDPEMASFCQVRVLCHSLAGNAVYVVTVTSKTNDGQDNRKKKGVVVSARVHPGETNSSWVMEGFLDFLLGDSEDAQLLRDHFIFKVVPMLNPDGVVVGNYRCSLAGRDLNRNYKTLLRDSFPCVWHTRNMVERFMAENDVVLYCDLHGHNRKNNVFMYGCNSKEDIFPKHRERVFPLMMSKNTRTKFSFKSCKFRVQKSKEGTGRIVMWKLGIRNSYTMEASFGGSTLGGRRGTHFTTQDLKSLGFCICDTLLDFCDPDPTNVNYCLTELAKIMKEVKEKIGDDLAADCMSDLETSTSGSNSTDSDGLPIHLLKQSQPGPTGQVPANKKKKQLKTRKERNTQQKRHTVPKQLNAIKDKSVGKHKVKLQFDDLTRRGKNSRLSEVSQVTLWSGDKPIEEEVNQEESLEFLNNPYGQLKTAPCPCRTMLPPVPPQTGDPMIKTHRSRSTQQLHLSSNPSPSYLRHTRQLSHPQRHIAPHKVFPSLSTWTSPSIKPSTGFPPFMYVKMIPPIQQTKRPQTTSNPKSNRKNSLGEKKNRKVSEFSLASSGSPPSKPNFPKKR